nr:arginine--tRNA ligase, chloroplastic/mitochondrial-like isoform X2 [Tanacetum cinerariifolium]
MWRATHDRPPNPSNLEKRSSQSVGFSTTKFRKVSKAIMRNLPANDIIESCCVAGPGYVNVILSKQWMAQ